MVHNKHSIGLASLLGLAALFLVSCGSGDSGGSTPTAAAVNAVMAQTATVGTSVYGSDFAVFGVNGVSLAGGSYTDSYSSKPSANRPWTAAGLYTNGNVGTNGTGSCAIQISKQAKDYGMALVGTGGTPASGICISGGAQVLNNNIGSLAVALNAAVPTDSNSSGGTTEGNLSLAKGATRTLAAGEYNFSGISLIGGSKLNLSGPSTLHINGPLTLSQGSSIVVNSGPVTIYENGTSFNISGGSLINTTLIPKQLIIYGTSTAANAALNLSGASSQYMMVRAPTYGITIAKGQSTFGSIIGNNVTVSGGSSVHHDEALNGYLMGGAIQGNPLFLTGSVSTLASGINGRGITTDGTYLYLPDYYAGTVSQVAIASGTVTTLGGLSYDYHHGITTDGTNLYVPDYNGGTVSQVAIANGAVTILASGLSSPLSITTDGTYLYVPDYYGGTVSQVAIANGAVTTLSGLFYDYHYSITTDGTYLYVTNYNAGTINQVAIANGAVTTQGGLSNGFHWGITTDGTNLYVTDYNAGTVSQVAIASGTVTILASGLIGPWGITTDGTSLFVMNIGSGTISRIN